MIPAAHVVHIIDRRVRIKVPAKLGDVEYFARVYEGLIDFPSLEDLRVSALTGSIIINHSDSSIAPLKQYAHEKQLFSLEDDSRQPEVLLQRASNVVGSVDSGIKQLTGGELDLRSVLFILLMAVAIRQLLRGNIVGPASAFLLEALGLLLATSIGN